MPREINDKTTNSIATSASDLTERIRAAKARVTLTEKQKKLPEVRFSDLTYHQFSGIFTELENDNTTLVTDEDTAKETLRVLRSVNPGCIVKEADREERKRIKETFSENFWKVNLGWTMMKERYYIEDRTFSSLVDPAMTKEADYTNDYLCRKIANGTPEEKKEMISAYIEKIGNIDLSKYDLTDDRDFAENYEKYFRLCQYADTQNIIKLSNAYGVDLTEPRFRKYCEKAGALNEMWMLIGAKEKVLGNALYDRVDIDKLDSEQARDISENKAFSKGFSYSLVSHSLGLMDKKSAVYRDKSLTPAERAEKMMKAVNPTTPVYQASVAKENEEKAAFNALSEEEKANAPRPDTVPEDTPDRYFERLRLDYIHRIAESGYPDSTLVSLESNATKLYLIREMQADYNRRLAAGEKLSAEQVAFDYSREILTSRENRMRQITGVCSTINNMGKDLFERVVADDRHGLDLLCEKIDNAVEEVREQTRTNAHDYYKAQVLQNVERIRKYAPGFTMTDEEVEAMVTPERIAMHDRAKAAVMGLYDKTEEYHTLGAGCVPKSFNRVIPCLMKKKGEEGAEEYNKDLFDRLGAPTAEGHAFRCETVVNTLNRIADLDPAVYNLGEKEFFDYAIDNYEISYAAFDVKSVYANNSSAGFTFNEQTSEALGRQCVYVTNLGSPAVNLVNNYADDFMFCFPSEKLAKDEKLLEKLLGCADRSVSTAANNTYRMNFEAADIKRMKSQPAPEIYRCSVNDIVTTEKPDELIAPDIAEARKTFGKLYTELKNTDHFYNFNNHDEYKNLVASLEKADKVFAELENKVIPSDRYDELRRTVLNVCECAHAYSEKNGKDADATRKERTAIAVRINTFGRKIAQTDPVDNPDGRASLDHALRAFIRANDAAAEKFAQREAEEYAAARSARADAKTTERERIFNLGLRKTEAERAKIDTMKRNTTDRKAQIMAVKARDELTNMVGRSGNDANKIRALMATVVCCEKLIADPDKKVNMDHDEINARIMALYGDKKFAKAVKTDTDAVNAFLLDGGSKQAAERYDALVSREAGRNAAVPGAPENNGPAVG